MIKEDKNIKKNLRFKTIFEYKDTLIYTLFSVLTLVICVAAVYIISRIPEYFEHDYRKIHIIKPWFTLFSPTFMVGIVCFFVEMYLLYEIRKNHLSDRCNLKTVNSGVIFLKDYWIYLLKSKKQNYSMYLFYDMIECCLYDKRFKRVELYGQFYKLVRNENGEYERPVYTDKIVIYDIYSISLIDLLKSKNIDVKIKKKTIVDDVEVDNEKVLNYEDGLIVENRINNATDDKLASVINEFFHRDENVVLVGSPNYLDNKNFFKYYIIRLIFLLICVCNILWCHWYGTVYKFFDTVKYIEHVIAALVFFKIAFCGYNSFDMYIQIKSNIVTFEEISRIFSRNGIKHIYEFSVGEIIELKRFPVIGCKLIVTGRYMCADNLQKIEEYTIKNYEVRIKMKRKDYYGFKNALKRRVDYNNHIRESDFYNFLAYHDWR